MITRMEVFSAQASAPELQLGGSLASDDSVHIRDIQGLEPVKANINTTPYASGRGELYQGATTGKRNVVLTLGLNPDYETQTVSTLRQLLYAYFMPEQWCKLRFFSDYLPTVDIEGYVEGVTPNIFSQDPEIQVSVICPKPDFVEVDATILIGEVSEGETQYVFDYLGTISTGFELKIESAPANEEYTGILDVVLKAPSIPQPFTVDPVTIDASKYFKLSSVRNQKRVQNVAVVDGTITNLLAGMTPISVWPELHPGENEITISMEEAGQKWTLAYFNRYGGL